MKILIKINVIKLKLKCLTLLSSFTPPRQIMKHLQKTYFCSFIIIRLVNVVTLLIAFPFPISWFFFFHYLIFHFPFFFPCKIIWSSKCQISSMPICRQFTEKDGNGKFPIDVIRKIREFSIIFFFLDDFSSSFWWGYWIRGLWFECYFFCCFLRGVWMRENFWQELNENLKIWDLEKNRKNQEKLKKNSGKVLKNQ